MGCAGSAPLAEPKSINHSITPTASPANKDQPSEAQDTPASTSIVPVVTTTTKNAQPTALWTHESRNSPDGHRQFGTDGGGGDGTLVGGVVGGAAKSTAEDGGEAESGAGTGTLPATKKKAMVLGVSPELVEEFEDKPKAYKILANDSGATS